MLCVPRAQVCVSETLVWRTVEMLKRLDLERLTDRQTDGAQGAHQAATDVPIQVRPGE
jgi:hypothetical protein